MSYLSFCLLRGALVCLRIFVWLHLLTKKALSQNTSICTKILSYIIVNWSSFRRWKRGLKNLRTLAGPINAQDLYYAQLR